MRICACLAGGSCVGLVAGVAAFFIVMQILDGQQELGW